MSRAEPEVVDCCSTLERQTPVPNEAFQHAPRSRRAYNATKIAT